MGWDETLATGDAAVDEQHQMLFSIFDEIADASEQQLGHRAISHLLIRLSDYVSLHFAEEEQLMQRYGYPRLEAHCAEHIRLSEKTRNLVLAHRLGVESAVPLTMLLRDWVFEHIKVLDQEFAEFVRATQTA